MADNPRKVAMAVLSEIAQDSKNTIQTRLQAAKVILTVDPYSYDETADYPTIQLPPLPEGADCWLLGGAGTQWKYKAFPDGRMHIWIAEPDKIGKDSAGWHYYDPASNSIGVRVGEIPAVMISKVRSSSGCESNPAPPLIDPDWVDNLKEGIANGQKYAESRGDNATYPMPRNTVYRRPDDTLYEIDPPWTIGDPNPPKSARIKDLDLPVADHAAMDKIVTDAVKSYEVSTPAYEGIGPEYRAAKIGSDTVKKANTSVLIEGKPELLAAIKRLDDARFQGLRWGPSWGPLDAKIHHPNPKICTCVVGYKEGDSPSTGRRITEFDACWTADNLWMAQQASGAVNAVARPKQPFHAPVLTEYGDKCPIEPPPGKNLTPPWEKPYHAPTSFEGMPYRVQSGEPLDFAKIAAEGGPVVENPRRTPGGSIAQDMICGLPMREVIRVINRLKYAQGVSLESLEDFISKILVKPEPMTLERAVAVLNDRKHRSRENWHIYEAKVYSPDEPDFQGEMWLFPGEVIAIAEKIEREK